jgi:hypothetical protein
MPHHNYISRNIFVSILFLGIFAFLIPISDGIPLLIIAGGVFAFYRLREKKELVVIEA